jgi:hypothetical protein
MELPAGNIVLDPNLWRTTSVVDVPARVSKT